MYSLMHLCVSMDDCWYGSLAQAGVGSFIGDDLVLDVMSDTMRLSVIEASLNAMAEKLEIEVENRGVLGARGE